MASPQKGKDKKKERAQSKKRQLLNVFHHSVTFLQIFSTEELDYLEQRLHIFVFGKGQLLAKQKQTIDFIGVIAQGRAIAKSKHYQIGELIGHHQLFGGQVSHQQSIVGQSDGIIIALRLYDLLAMDRFSLRNKIISQIAAYNLAQLIKRQSVVKHIMQFQTVDQKKISKYFSNQFSGFYNQLQPKQKIKFGSFFPFYTVKQKQLIANNTLRPYLLYVIQGQVTAKLKQEQKIIQAGKFYNVQNFIFDQNCPQNIYCLSSEAIFLLIDKEILRNNFKSESFKCLISILMTSLVNTHKKQVQLCDDKESKSAQKWSIFKKYPNSQIIPLNKKTETKIKKNDANSNKQINFLTFQTLFRQQLSSSDKKQKTNSSAAESGYEKLLTLKTQVQGKQIQTQLQLEKLRKQVQILSQKLKFNDHLSKQTKLQLIQSKSRTSMGEVFKQIKKLYQQNEVAHSNHINSDSVGDQKKITFKEAFDNQMKQSKIQILVAKCAFRWLYLTRKKKASMKKS